MPHSVIFSARTSRMRRVVIDDQGDDADRSGIGREQVALWLGRALARES